MLYCFTELTETFWFIIEHYFMCINNYKVLEDEDADTKTDYHYIYGEPMRMEKEVCKMNKYK